MMPQNLSLSGIALAGAVTLGWSTAVGCAGDEFTVGPGEDSGTGGDGGDGGSGGDGGAMVVPGTQYIPVPVRPTLAQTLAPSRAFLLWQAGALPEGKTVATYDVCWTRDGFSQIDDASECPNAAAVVPTHRVIDALQPNATYYWKVRARYNDGWTSDFTVPFAFSTDGSLAGRWLFEGNVDDASGLGHTGMLQNGAVYAAGLVGQGLSFDGVNDRATIPDANDLDFGTGDFSVGAWVYPKRDGVAEALIAKRSTGNGWELYRSATGQLVFFASACGNAAMGAGLPKNEWRHVTATRTGTSVRLYVGGVLAGMGTCAENFTNGAAVSFGCNGPDDTCSEQFQGLLDEVGLYRSALSTDSIVNDFCAAEALAGTDPLPAACQ